MATLLYTVSKRGVRSMHHIYFRPPWPFVKKGNTGQRKIGPVRIEAHKFPGQNREFELLTPKWKKENDPRLHRYTGVQETGFVDEKTGKYVHVPEMVNELVVPDLTGFKLKPYVSYRTDVTIEARRTAYEAKVREKGSEAMADLHTSEEQRWPPPKMTPETLFELCYGEQVRKAYKKDEYSDEKTVGAKKSDKRKSES
ncbi:hypothetical protein WR25_20801 [Diploscapter pachys]|uniref:39S ribosomal protein L41, mitochondrial n=1 Tax=Diploscapter pachys TaxID=2018661 RepID=A0A2A2JD85_9BILA|nr:hypothetical protein WR25_20801 [Diploscapter pachys]